MLRHNSLTSWYKAKCGPNVSFYIGNLGTGQTCCVHVRLETPAQGQGSQAGTHSTSSFKLVFCHQGCRLPPWEDAASKHGMAQDKTTAAVSDSHRGPTKGPSVPSEFVEVPIERWGGIAPALGHRFFPQGLCISKAKLCKSASSHCCSYNIICIQTIKNKPITSYLHA